MPKANIIGSNALKSSKEIFRSTTAIANGERVIELPLSELVIDLLDKVDAKQLAFNPAVELSYLSQKEQIMEWSGMRLNRRSLSLYGSKR